MIIYLLERSKRRLFSTLMCTENMKLRLEAGKLSLAQSKEMVKQLVWLFPTVSKCAFQLKLHISSTDVRVETILDHESKKAIARFKGVNWNQGRYIMIALPMQTNILYDEIDKYTWHLKPLWFLVSHFSVEIL